MYVSPPCDYIMYMYILVFAWRIESGRGVYGDELQLARMIYERIFVGYLGQIITNQKRAWDQWGNGLDILCIFEATCWSCFPAVMSEGVDNIMCNTSMRCLRLGCYCSPPVFLQSKSFSDIFSHNYYPHLDICRSPKPFSGLRDMITARLYSESLPMVDLLHRVFTTQILTYVTPQLIPVRDTPSVPRTAKETWSHGHLRIFSW